MRPCLLVIDNEYPESISTRKLVLETAKINVITCYSPQEGIETLARFPAVDGIVLDAEVRGMTCEELVARLRKIHDDLPIVVISPSGHQKCAGETHRVSSYDPKQLLAEVERICGREMDKIVHNDENLGRRFASESDNGEGNG